MEGLFEEVIHLAVIGRCGGQTVHLIFSLYDDLERSNHLNWLSIYLNRNDLVINFTFESDGFTLPDDKWFIHADLHLSHVKYITQTYNLQHTIAETLLFHLSIFTVP